MTKNADVSTFSDDYYHQICFLNRRSRNIKNEESTIIRWRGDFRFWWNLTSSTWWRHNNVIGKRQSSKFEFGWNFMPLSDILPRFITNGNIFEILQRTLVSMWDGGEGWWWLDQIFGPQSHPTFTFITWERIKMLTFQCLFDQFLNRPNIYVFNKTLKPF